MMVAITLCVLAYMLVGVSIDAIAVRVLGESTNTDPGKVVTWSLFWPLILIVVFLCFVHSLMCRWRR